jgi:hypothetical protein
MKLSSITHPLSSVGLVMIADVTGLVSRRVLWRITTLFPSWDWIPSP